MYKLMPLQDNMLVVPLKPVEVKKYTSKLLADIDTGKLDVLNYGRVVSLPPSGFTEADTLSTIMEGDVVLYQKLAAHKTNFGNPRQVLVSLEHIEGRIVETDA